MTDLRHLSLAASNIKANWPISLYKRTKYIRLTTTIHLTLMMTSAQVVESSVTTTENSPSQDYSHPDDQTTLIYRFSQA